MGRYSAKSFVWIPRFVYQKDFDFIRDDSFSFYANKGRLPSDNDKILLVVDGKMLENVKVENQENFSSQRLKMYYNDTSTVARFEDDSPRYDRNAYPYVSLLQSRGIGEQTRPLNKLV